MAPPIRSPTPKRWWAMQTAVSSPGNTTNPSRYRGNYITGAVTTAAGGEKMLNISANPQLIFQSLGECVAAFQNLN